MTGAALTRVAAAVAGVWLVMANRAELTAGRVPPDHALEARIDALVAPQVHAGLVSGVILVARGTRLLALRSYGFADWEHRVPNTPSTRFGIASLTKPLTETLVDLLARDGRLDLDAPVERYLPGFPRGPHGGIPAIRHLVTHRSGVPHRVTDASEEILPLHPADIVERVKRTGLLFEPGTERLYSSAGFTCLARVIEIVEKQSFEAVLESRIFEPAGMVSAISETGQQLMPNRARPYRLSTDAPNIAVAHAPFKDLRFLAGAGSVYATPADLMRFVLALRTGVFGADEWARIAGSDVADWTSWTGRTNGYEASLDVLAADDLIFVFMANLQSAANWQIRERVQKILRGGNAEAIPLPPAVATPFEQPDALVGSYGPAGSAAVIAVRDGRLFRGDNEFYPIADHRYYVPASGTIMYFRRDRAGRVDALVGISGGGEESVLPRLEGR